MLPTWGEGHAGKPWSALPVPADETSYGLGPVPEQLRPQRFLDQHVRSASDRTITATTINWQNDEMGEIMAEKMRKNRKRLDALRVALGNHAEKNLPRSFAQLPQTRAAREAR
jgi:hypothetical protein